jgi:hypothetical protein
MVLAERSLKTGITKNSTLYRMAGTSLRRSAIDLTSPILQSGEKGCCNGPR